MPRRPKRPKPAAQALLRWYDRHRRRLPWRAAPGQTPDPYAVWLSEIMLQQTTVAAVKRYFESFLNRWPTVTALASAPLEDVTAAWAGLGYYARARNLHACAKTVAEQHGGVFPDTEEELRKLPGIGAYTAAAVTAIAFDRRAVVMDGNVERVMARLFAVTDPLPKVKPALYALADALTPKVRAGDYAQGVMDLGATVCTPKNPNCMLCPWSDACEAKQQGIAETLPRKLKKAKVPVRHGVAFWLTRGDGAVLLRRRPPKGLLGGMMEIPSTDWRTKTWTQAEAAKASPLNGGPKPKWRSLTGSIGHTFTHFHLEMTVMAARLTAAQAKKAEGQWISAAALLDQGLPTVMRKVALHAMKGDN